MEIEVGMGMAFVFILFLELQSTQILQTYHSYCGYTGFCPTKALYHHLYYQRVIRILSVLAPSPSNHRHVAEGTLLAQDNNDTCLILGMPSVLLMLVMMRYLQYADLSQLHHTSKFMAKFVGERIFNKRTVLLLLMG